MTLTKTIISSTSSLLISYSLSRYSGDRSNNILRVSLTRNPYINLFKVKPVKVIELLRQIYKNRRILS